MSKQKKQTDGWNKPFPTRLRGLMDDTKTTQAALAGVVGMTRQGIALYASGQTTPDIETFVKIADFFGVSYEYLLGKSNAKKRENVDIHERTGLSDDAIESLISLNHIINDSEGISLVDESSLVDDSKRILKVINFILGHEKGVTVKSVLSVGGQFILDIGRYLFTDYEGENEESKDLITLIDKQTKRKTGFKVSTVKQSLLSEIIFQLREWEKNIRTNKEKL
jgi:transcriptional regulator with XRE-family HTH domain